MGAAPHKKRARLPVSVTSTPSTSLSAVFRRIANEAPAAVDAPADAAFVDGEALEIFGFAELEPEPETVMIAELASGPADEDILALLAAQPEIAPLGEDDLSIVVPAATAAPRRPQPPETPPAPASEPVMPPISAPEPAPPEAPPSPSRARTLVARLSRVGAESLRARAVWPGFLTQVPVEGEPPPAPPPPPVPPPMPAPRRPSEMPAPGSFASVPNDRTGRQPVSRNRRLYRRVPLGAGIEIDGVKCGVIDLSIGGFAAAGTVYIAANTVVPVTLRLTIDGIEVATRLNARIVYSHRARSSGRFVEPTPSQIALLRYLVTWRGESVGTVGTTTLLDAITGGPDHGFPPGSSAAPRERWWSGMIGRKVRPPR